MEFFQGFSQCWWPSSTCQIWWEAWSAIGSILAAIVTLAAVMTALKTSRNALEHNKRIEDERRELAQAKDDRSAAAICRALRFETQNSLSSRIRILDTALTEPRSEFSAKTLVLRMGLDSRAILRIAANRVEILPASVAKYVFEDLAGVEAFMSFVRPTGRMPDNIDENQIERVYDLCQSMGRDLSARDQKLINAIEDIYGPDGTA